MSVAIDVALLACELGAASSRFGGIRRAAYAQAAGSLRLVKAVEDAEQHVRRNENSLAVVTSHAA